jgi:hypothetical protein
MKPAKLAMMCRCGHAGRFHNTGSIWVGYETDCLKSHGASSPLEYQGGFCQYFEPVDTWQETFAATLRENGWLVERVARDERGRFVRRQVPA